MTKFYTCEEIATRYGVEISTVWSWIRDKKLPALRIGKQYRISEKDLIAYEKEGRTM